jgi:ribonuclease P/MRP protein subunit RPP1
VSCAYPKIDIVAVRPTNMDICKHACQTLEVDVISLDLAKSRVIPGFVPAQVAVNRGIFFEICYTQSLRGKIRYVCHKHTFNLVLIIDPQKRFLFYNNVKRLVEVTRGQNLIFTSEALKALEIKRPTDLRIL